MNLYVCTPSCPVWTSPMGLDAWFYARMLTLNYFTEWFDEERRREDRHMNHVNERPFLFWSNKVFSKYRNNSSWFALHFRATSQNITSRDPECCLYCRGDLCTRSTVLAWCLTLTNVNRLLHLRLPILSGFLGCSGELIVWLPSIY